MIQTNNQWRLVWSIGLGTLLTAYGSSAVTSVLPLIAHDFGHPTADAKEVVTLYLFALCALLPFAGRLGDRIGHRRLYLYGVGLSFLGAFLCAYAPGLGFLAFFRIIEGAGTACILSGGAAMITQHCVFRRRGIGLSWLSTMAYIGLAVTPAFSGWLAGVFGWRAIFVAQLPLAMWAFFSAARALPEDAVDILVDPSAVWSDGVDAGVGSYEGDDAVGRMFAVPADFALPSRSPVSSSLLRPNPLFPRRSLFESALLTHRPVLFAAVAAMLTYTALYGLTFVLPGYLMDARGLHPAQAGLILSVWPLLTALAAPIGGLLADRCGVRKPQAAGVLLLFIAFIAVARWGLQSSLVPLVAATAVIGVGMGIFLPSNHHLIMSSAAPGYRGAAAATIALCRNLGMLTATALCGWLYSSPEVVLIISSTILFVAFVCTKHRNVLSSRGHLLTN